MSASFPASRLSRLRKSPAMRQMFAENSLRVSDFIVPLFVVPGSGVKKEISSMPGQYHFSLDMLSEEVKRLGDQGLNNLLLFGIPENKDPEGMVACDQNGIVQQAARTLRENCPSAVLIADLCFCEYTTHGYCGVMDGDRLDHDVTRKNLGTQAISLARSGVDIVAPSGMIDGMVGQIRSDLDAEKFQDVAIMSYSVKYASAWYGPFRDAVESAPDSGDRKSHQMNAANSREALREAKQDIAEGADCLIVKPALSFLDIIYSLKQETDLPVIAYNVSGEYSMIKAAGKLGLADEKELAIETLTSIKRSGADLIISYFASQLASKFL